MKSVLALDISSRATGWAFGLPGDKPISGVEHFAREGDTPDEIFLRAGVWLTQQISVLSPQIVAMEAAILTSGGGFTNPHTADLLQGIQHVFRFVVKAKLPGRARLVASSTARKTFTGRGRFEKGRAKDAVQFEAIRRAWLTDETLQPDIADALAVWCAVASEQNPDLDYRRASKALPMSIGA